MDDSRQVLWAPWRGVYVTSTPKRESGCVFCEKIAADNDKEDLVLYRGSSCVVVMNLYPYNNGHVMVIPKRHTANLAGLSDKECVEMAYLRRFMTEVLTEAMNCDGFNAGLNLGEAAGAGIAAHLHEHIVPRWKGDTNFMPVVAGTKVISEQLYSTYDKIKKVILKKIQGE